jgi:6-phosphogluconate dehydrogenase
MAIQTRGEVECFSDRDEMLRVDLPAAALHERPDLSDFAGRVSDSGEGRWALEAAIDESVPASIPSTAMNERFASRGENDFADRLLSAMRFQFGGHQEKR